MSHSRILKSFNHYSLWFAAAGNLVAPANREGMAFNWALSFVGGGIMSIRPSDIDIELSPEDIKYMFTQPIHYGIGTNFVSTALAYFTGLPPFAASLVASGLFIAWDITERNETCYQMKQSIGRAVEKSLLFFKTAVSNASSSPVATPSTPGLR